MHEISWIALTCNLDGTDIYLGLTAGLDDIVSHRIKANQMVAFPFQHIRIAAGDREEIPLRVYAVRDPSIVRIVPIQESAPVKGFTRVRLELFLPPPPLTQHTSSQLPSSAQHTDRTPTAAQAKCTTNGELQRPPDASVMAFLLTIGLPHDQEDQFYRTVVNDFLNRSLMTLPRLLHEVGCSSPSEVARGDEHPCPC